MFEFKFEFSSFPNFNPPHSFLYLSLSHPSHPFLYLSFSHPYPTPFSTLQFSSPPHPSLPPTYRLLGREIWIWSEPCEGRVMSRCSPCFKSKASSAPVPILLAIGLQLIKLHGYDNRGGITVKTCTKRTCSQMSDECNNYYNVYWSFIYLLMKRTRLLNAVYCWDETGTNVTQCWLLSFTRRAV